MSARALSRRMASTAVDTSKPRTIVLVGAGFLGSYIARALIADPRNRVRIVSRNPQSLYERLKPLGSQILPPHSADITSSDTSQLDAALADANAVVSLTGILVGSEKKMIAVQEEGARRVAEAAKKGGVDRVVGISAIGADRGGVTPYFRTKAAAEEIFLSTFPTATIIRPSIVFGPGDSFFTRFATLAKFLPFLPVFGGGVVQFQPVYAGDIARAVEICCRDDPAVVDVVGGKTIEAGGPDVFTYKEIMQLVLKYSGLEGRRLILSLPYWLGMIQAFFLEKLPESNLTLTRDQVKQLRIDNIVSPTPPMNSLAFKDLLSAFPPSLPSSSPPDKSGNLTSVYKMLPQYLGPNAGSTSPQSGKRTHGRGTASEEDLMALRRKSK